MIESVFYLNNKKILRIETILGEWKHRLTSGNKLEIESRKKKETTRMLIICFAALKDLRRVWRKNIREASEHERIFSPTGYVLILLWPSSKRIVISYHRWWNWIGQEFNKLLEFQRDTS